METNYWEIKRWFTENLDEPKFDPGYQAAVIIPIIKLQNNNAGLILTKRSPNLTKHGGQVSFPGGTKEEPDKDDKFTALRETEEELSVSSFNYLKRWEFFWTPFYSTVSSFLGFIDEAPSLVNYNRSEISSVLQIDFADFENKDIHETRNKEYQQITYKIHYYHLKNETIWGATGGLINKLVELVRQI